MIQVFPGQLPLGFSDLFRTSAPTGIRALAVLAGGNAGKIFTIEYFDRRDSVEGKDIPGYRRS